MFAPNVNIVDSDFHSFFPPEERLKSPGFENDEPVVIGENVWVGMNVTILKGVSIGKNSVIGASSLVTRNVGENVLFVGVPARKRDLA